MTSGGADRIGGAAFVRLEQRRDFVAAARGSRRHAQHFVLQVRPRGDAPAPARFGLTVTKKTYPLSVHRNRVRRRFREALRTGAALSAQPGCDYVLIARETAISAPFEQLKTEIAAALAAPPRERRPKDRPKAT